MDFLGRIRQGLSRTTRQLVDRLDQVFRSAGPADAPTRPVDLTTLEALEEVLIAADVGVGAANRLVEVVRARASTQGDLRGVLKSELRRLFGAVDQPILVTHHPLVTLV